MRIDPLVSVPIVNAAKHRGCGDTRPAARSARRARQVVRIQRLTAVRADAGQAEGELVQVDLAEHHGSGLAQHSHLKRVLRRHDAHERKRAAGGRHVGGVVVVLEQDRDAVQRTARATLARARDPARARPPRRGD